MTDKKCISKTKKGTRCRNNALKNSNKCGVHGKVTKKSQDMDKFIANIENLGFLDDDVYENPEAVYNPKEVQKYLVSSMKDFKASNNNVTRSLVLFPKENQFSISIWKKIYKCCDRSTRYALSASCKKFLKLFVLSRPSIVIHPLYGHFFHPHMYRYCKRIMCCTISGDFETDLKAQGLQTPLEIMEAIQEEFGVEEFEEDMESNVWEIYTTLISDYAEKVSVMQNPQPYKDFNFVETTCHEEDETEDYKIVTENGATFVVFKKKDHESILKSTFNIVFDDCVIQAFDI